MNERIKELAEQAGLMPMWVCVNEPTGSQIIKPIGEQTIERFAELIREDAFGLPSIEDASQNWDKIDSAVAWHLIERHAENWADVGKMMDEYVQAKMHAMYLEYKELEAKNYALTLEVALLKNMKVVFKPCAKCDDDRSISPAGIHGDW